MVSSLETFGISGVDERGILSIWLVLGWRSSLEDPVHPLWTSVPGVKFEDQMLMHKSIVCVWTVALGNASQRDGFTGDKVDRNTSMFRSTVASGWAVLMSGMKSGGSPWSKWISRAVLSGQPEDSNHEVVINNL